MNSPLIFATLGYKNTGRMTIIEFLAEILWENGSRRIKVVHPEEFEKLTIIKALTNVGNSLVIHTETPEVILIPRIGKELYDNLRTNHRAIVLFVSGGVGNSNSCDEEVKWLNNITPDFHINNDSTMRILKFVLRNLFLNEIIKHKYYN